MNQKTKHPRAELILRAAKWITEGWHEKEVIRFRAINTECWYEASFNDINFVDVDAFEFQVAHGGYF